MNSLSVVTSAVAALLGQTASEEQVAGMLAAFAGIWLFIVFFSLAILAFVIFLWWRIFDKTGFGGVYSLLILIPGFGMLIVLLILAFGNWPALSQRPNEPMRPPMA